MNGRTTPLEEISALLLHRLAQFQWGGLLLQGQIEEEDTAEFAKVLNDSRANDI